jgi:hypothetical protein
MNASTSEISTFIHTAGTSKVDSEVRSAALVWFVSLLGTALPAFIVHLLDIVSLGLNNPRASSTGVIDSPGSFQQAYSSGE